MNGLCNNCGEDWGGKFVGAVCPARENAVTVAARLRANELNSGEQETFGFTDTVEYVGKEMPVTITPAGLLAFDKPGCEVLGHWWFYRPWIENDVQFCDRCGLRRNVSDIPKPASKLYSVQKVSSARVIPVEIKIEVIPMRAGLHV